MPDQIGVRDLPPTVRAVPSEDGRTVRIRCPYCGKLHVHGAAGLLDRGVVHRLAHCAPMSAESSAGYLLQLGEDRGNA